MDNENKPVCGTLFAFSLWYCWLGGRKGIRTVKKLSGEVLAWLSVWSEMQTCIWPSGCHCHSLSLASVKSRLVLPFWYQLTRVVPEKRLLNVNSSMLHYECVALCKDISLQRGRFCTRSLASYIPRSSEDRSSWMFFIQDPAKTGRHECSLSRLCTAAPVVASSSLEEVQRWLG